MKSADRQLRRALLKPLVRRRTAPANDKRIEAAFEALEERAIATAALPEVVQEMRRERLNKDQERWKDAGVATRRVQSAIAMYRARRVSFSEYAFLVASAAEGVCDGRISAGSYSDIEQVSEEMRAIEVAHGLKAKEFWRVEDAPSQYRELSVKWDQVADEHFAATLDELEGYDVGTLFKNDRGEFDRVRERGRRSFFHKGEFISALKDTVVRYEHEARAAASIKAFTAGVILLGAAVEGLLLLRCLRSRVKASRAAAKLPRKKRPQHVAAPATWTFDTLIHVCLQAGWLPEIETPSIGVRPDGLAHLLRQMRNFVHPGNVSAQRPWIEVDGRDFSDAETVYTTLFMAMSGNASR
jgi:hypothetical protein